jgi:predicted nucleotidyltransferase
MVAIRDIQAVADEIARRFDPERIILFGSHARGDAAEHSDVDLLIVMDCPGDALERRMKMWSAVRPPFAVDLIVRSPEDVAYRYEQFDPLVREALDRGRVLHDRRCSRVASEGR